uniref:hypothetical protein n=1 Tax=Clostridium sp. 12(A) TaxID=1163671 RepID=UPI000464C634|nr:hypothetical protein [Clostridium sp. 12(A)]
MKTLCDLEEMKNKGHDSYENYYDYFIAYLSHCYVSKLSGFAIVKSELSKWDNESQFVILTKLIEELREMDMQSGYDKLLELLNEN